MARVVLFSMFLVFGITGHRTMLFGLTDFKRVNGYDRCIRRSAPLRDIMCANNHISPIWPHGTSILIPRQGFAHIYKCIEARVWGVASEFFFSGKEKKRENGPKASSSSLPLGPSPILP